MKVNSSAVFIPQSYLAVPKTTGINATHYFIMKYLAKENSNK